MKSVYKAFKDLQDKKVSSVELTQDCIKEAQKAKNNTYISMTNDLAIEQAKESDELLNRSKERSNLEGIPYSLKDLFITKNIRTTGGSRSLFNYIPPYEGSISGFLKASGANLMGKVGCDEFGMGSTNEKTVFGTILNPLNEKFVAGGSSGGSAASVSEGSSLFSIGTDTGGSVRLPANFCALTGIKPTYGRVSRYGQLAYASSLDQASPMASSARDLAMIMEIITQKDSRDATQCNLPPINLLEDLKNKDVSFLKGKKIGIDRSFVEACSESVRKSLEEALSIFEKLGVELVDVNLDHLKYCVSAYYIIATSEASANLARYDGIHYGYRAKSIEKKLEQTYIESRTLGLGDEVKKRILLGTFSLSSGYQDQYFAQACKVRRLILNDFLNAFKEVDWIFSPVCATSAFKLKEGSMDPIKMYMNDLYTIPANLSGLPALAMPYGMGANSMPTGFQLIGNHFEDESLIRASHAFQSETMEGLL